MRLPITLLACAAILAPPTFAKEPEKLPGSRVLPTPVKAEPPKEPRRELTEAEVAAMVKQRLEAMRRARAARAAAEAKAAENQPKAKRSDTWSYEGDNGPQKWGKINPAWAKCDSGHRQAPIDIRDGIKVDLEPVQFEYGASGFNIINNGHTVQVNVAPGNRFTLTGRTYELQQFHFHRPAEEKVDGRGFDMVAHLVHKDEEGRLAVIAVLIESGEQHPGIQTVWNNLPLEKYEPLVPVIQFDPSMMLPERREYYTFMGSLTTPPCDEGVLWIVMKEPIKASKQQLDIFARLYPMNARPVQALSGRLIKESN
ncbi:carbonic anhydrase [Noviherbaspirillum denitrificans]|uniref:carbonic anhydrase n=1 Tax=Noviherbaspirillum denitrificans TaxID=1968433 RepID=A0A254TJH6_9BURK|nr:carbonic anhydrase family protein [Noviherbaspirillum denitrificans]OWW22655.1 carbonate dehydratase [Noviherbaspirillum denitrificans]